MSRLVKILVLTANPKETDRLRLDEEIRSIDRALLQSEYRNRFKLEQQWAVRIADLQSLLLRFKPDIVHFSGHGSSSSEIMLEDNNGNSKPVPTHALSDLFSLLKENIKCVILNSCYSEEQAQAIAQHISFVVGMSKAISDYAAISFSEAFYGSLGEGKSIKTAFELGRNRISLEFPDEQDTVKLKAVSGNPEEMILSIEDIKTEEKWGTPRDYERLIIVGTVCLGIIILLLAYVLGVLNGSLSSESLKGKPAIGFGGGLLGLGYILRYIIKTFIVGGAVK